MTAAQLKQKFAAEGKTFTEWAAANNFRRSEVYCVLNGQNKALRGRGHAIAVALGLKKAGGAA
jgi:gp16 family phage-associated protein